MAGGCLLGTAAEASLARGLLSGPILRSFAPYLKAAGCVSRDGGDGACVERAAGRLQQSADLHRISRKGRLRVS